MPCKKDFDSVTENVHKQKRLILSNLKELYEAFEKTYPEVRIGYLKFCQLRPKWCIYFLMQVGPIQYVYAITMKILNCSLKQQMLILNTSIYLLE